MIDPTARRAAFRKLHEKGCFVMPNPWDRGSAVYLQSLGFSALASSSAGYAFTRGLPDSPSALSRDGVLEHLRDLVDGTEVPINADFQAGYGDTPAEVAESVRLCVATGVAGLSIEDATGNDADPLYPLDVALERLRAARAAIDATGADVMLTARAECFLVGHPEPLEESIKRLRAFAETGADVLYAPGVRDPKAIRAMVEAVAPKPVNILISGNMGLRVADIAALGARRISVGSALARVAWTAFMTAAKSIAEEGDFTPFQQIASTSDLSRLF